MKHRVAGRKLGRTSAHRLALLRNLATALFERERIKTTLGKAKELRPFAEKLVTLAKRETLHARRLVLRHVRDRKAVSKLFETYSARYAQRPGGYTRIIKLGPRRGDAAEMAIVELVGAELAAKKKAPEKGKGKAAAEPETAPEEAAAEAEPKKSAKAPRKKAAPKKEKKAPARKAKPKDEKGAGKPKAKPKPPAKTARKSSKGGGE